MGVKIRPGDLLGKALWDYYHGRQQGALWCHSSLPTSEEVAPGYFFRGFDQMPALEQKALGLCRGKVLDIGCGAGSHSLHLQERRLPVTGLDHSGKAIRIAELRGLERPVCRNVYDLEVGDFDTLLLLMNGAGIAGTLQGLERLLKHLLGLLRPGGQVLMDSSDLIYMFEEDADGGVWVPGEVSYYGEVTYQWEYGGETGEPFPWLFVDFRTLEKVAGPLGYEVELAAEGPHYDYLARLCPKAYQI